MQSFTRGLDEGQLADNSALRRKAFTAIFQTDADKFVTSTPIGGVSGADVSEWQQIAATGAVPGFYATLSALVGQSATPVVGTIQLRVYGLDQFGQALVETTPVISLAAKTNNHIYLAKVFSRVDAVEWRSAGLDSSTATLQVGHRFDWSQTDDASNEHIGGDNLGFGTMIQVAEKRMDGLGSDDVDRQVGVYIYDFTGPSSGGGNVVVAQNAPGWDGEANKFTLGESTPDAGGRDGWGLADVVALGVDVLTQANAKTP